MITRRPGTDQVPGTVAAPGGAARALLRRPGLSGRGSLSWTRRSLHAELVKVVTLPSVWLTAALTLATVALLGELAHTQAGLLVFGALAITHEYQGGGQIRATLLAVPRRPALLAAKLTAIALTATPLAAAAALLAGRPGTTGYLVATALLAAAAGILIRHPAAAITAVLSWYLIAGPALRARLAESRPSPSWFPDVVGSWDTALAWTAVLLVPGVVTFVRRDA